MDRHDFLIPFAILPTPYAWQPLYISGVDLVLFVYVTLDRPSHSETNFCEVKNFFNAIVIFNVNLVDVRVFSINQVIELDACVNENECQNTGRDDPTYDGINFCLAIDIECWDLFTEIIEVAEHVKEVPARPHRIITATITFGA